mmetsp:Transcript_22816/g.48231  ORF Transcript_22816/g.48231 Transcript_22816/m.48231 type:complete len:454 (+) Transcript_22816:3-1364(+)
MASPSASESRYRPSPGRTGGAKIFKNQMEIFCTLCSFNREMSHVFDASNLEGFLSRTVETESRRPWRFKQLIGQRRGRPRRFPGRTPVDNRQGWGRRTKTILPHRNASNGAHSHFSFPKLDARPAHSRSRFSTASRKSVTMTRCSPLNHRLLQLGCALLLVLLCVSPLCVRAQDPCGCKGSCRTVFGRYLCYVNDPDRCSKATESRLQRGEAWISCPSGGKKGKDKDDDKNPQRCMDLNDEEKKCKKAYSKYGLECIWKKGAGDRKPLCYDIFITKEDECKYIEKKWRCEDAINLYDVECEWDDKKTKCKKPGHKEGGHHDDDDYKPQACMDLNDEEKKCKKAYSKYGLECRWTKGAGDYEPLCYDIFITKEEECKYIETKYRCEDAINLFDVKCEWDDRKYKCKKPEYEYEGSSPSALSSTPSSTPSSGGGGSSEGSFTRGSGGFTAADFLG